MKVSELKKVLSCMSDEAEVEFCLQYLCTEPEIKSAGYISEDLEYAGYDCGYNVITIFLDRG